MGGDDMDVTQDAAGLVRIEGVEGRDIDPDALAFIKAKRKVDDLQRAKKMEKRIGAHWTNMIKIR